MTPTTGQPPVETATTGQPPAESAATGQPPAATAPEMDLVTAVQHVLAASSEPQTVSKIRAQLPAPFRSASLEELTDVLHRQVAANVLHSFPKYRSPQERFWDRPLNVHIAVLLREVLAEAPLPWSELRRRLPNYAVERGESILQEEVAQGRLHRHPRTARRGGERFGVRPADPKDYLRSELVEVFNRLKGMGFQEPQLRAAALELLQEEEWAPATAPARETPAGRSEEASGPTLAPTGSRPEVPANTEAPADTHHPAAPPPGEMPAIEQAETHPNAPDALTD